VWEPQGLWVVVRSPEVVRHVLKDGFDQITKSSPRDDWLMHLFTQFLGSGIFTLRHGSGASDGGAAWKEQRKIAANIFTRGNFNSNMADVFIAKAKNLRNCLKSGQVVDMQLCFFNFTMDSIMKIFFGEDGDTIAGKPNAFGAAFDDAHRSFFQYFLTSLPFLQLSDFFPWPFGGKDGLLMWWHGRLSRVYQQFVSSVSDLDTESERIIEKCRADPALSTRKDLLALFLQAAKREGSTVCQSTQYLRDVVLNFVIAGRDTTACTLSWMFYILSTHPDIQRRILEEVDRCAPLGTEPTLSQLHASNMPQLHALLYEALRLYPPVPLDIKEASEDLTLPDGSRLPKGCRIMYMPWAMGRDPELYPQPETVRLERWIPFKQPQPHEFPVFQAGPRICLGMDMAIFEAKLVACMLLQEFSFTLLQGEEEKIHYSPAITMSICNSKDQDSHNLWLVPQQRGGSPVAGAGA